MDRYAIVLAAVAALLIGPACGGDDSGGGGDDPDASLGVDGDGAPLPGWNALPPLPVAIQEIGVAAIDDEIYVVGGFIGLNIVADVHVYDIASGSWSRAADLPGPLHHANLAAVDGKLYVVGALVTNFAPSGTVLEYDPVADEWTPKSPLPTGFERGASAVGVVDGIIYIAGGTGQAQSVDQFTSYDPNTDTHDTTLANLPAALNHLVGAGVGGKMYAIGGRDVGINGIKSSTYEYDPVADEWAERAAMPTARGGCAAGVADGRIIVVGGEGNAAAGSGVFPQAESYDPAGDTWTPLEDMRTPRHGMGAAGVGKTLYVPAGADKQAFGAVKTFEAFTP